MTTTASPSTKNLDQTPGTLTEMAWDPITRIVGSLGIYTKIDFAKKTVAECFSTSSVFRGYSIFMKGKDPRDAHFITSRICGICGDNHATCSVYNQNMAYGVAPPTSRSGSSTAVRPPSSCSTTTSSRRTWSVWTTARR
jgi:Ni,Fe-hydrogenase I large subunit